MKTDYLLIGGGLACHEAAKQLRKDDENARITIVSDEAHLAYNRPPLSKQYMRGKLPKERLFFSKPEYFESNSIDTILGVAVTELKLDPHKAILADGREIEFGKALIATGGSPIALPVPGADLPGVFYLRTLDDAEGIAAAAKAGGTAVIIGAGFIGLEVAASLVEEGLDVHVVELESRIWTRFADEDLAKFVQDYCAERGVTFHTSEKVTEVLGDGQSSAVRLASGRDLPCDFVCVGIGIRPNVELAEGAGLTVDNGIVVNEFLQCSHPDVYAVGDVANFIDGISGNRRRVEHWGHAKFGGVTAARNMAGGEEPYCFLSYVWSDIFDLRINAAGDEHGYERMIMRGTFADGAFALLYLRGNQVCGCLTVKTPPKLFATLKKIIEQKIDISAHEALLADPDSDLATLLA